MKVALVYDRINKWGGAERVLLALHKMFPDAPLYTSLYDKKKTPWADTFTVIPSFLQKIPFVQDKHQLIPYLMPAAFESFAFDQYDLVISVTSEAAKGIITSAKTKHICYCLTPTRYLWSGYAEYFANLGLKLISAPAVEYLRHWDRIAAQRPDTMIAISEEIQQRIQKYYRRDSEVIYAPLLLKSIKENKRLAQILSQDRPFLLIVSRLIPYKRIDLAIKACNRLKFPLKIIGTGSDFHRLHSMAGPTVTFLGNLTDEDIITYYKYCKGFLFPGQEDFGLTVLEAQYYGKPVLAFNAGGARETIIPGVTGMFFDKQTVSSVTEQLAKFVKFRYNPDKCRRQAEKFSLRRFEREIYKAVDRTMSI